MIKLYYGKTKKGYWLASKDESKLKMPQVYDCEVETIHNNKVWMLRVYKGFDYNYANGGIYDDVIYSKLYHSLSKLKKDNETWKEAERLAKENPKKYHVTPFSIASDDYGEPFMYGDCFQGKFNIKAIQIKVI